MSVHFDRVRGHWIVRWRDNGRQRARRFDDEADARAFDSAVRGPETSSAESLHSRIENREAQLRAERGRDGVYQYATAAGTRWRFVFRRSDGSLTTRRGFTSRGAGVAARRAAVEAVRRGDAKVARETFGEFWKRLLAERRPYVTAGTLQDYATHGTKRLLPSFGELKLTTVDEDRVRDWLADMGELVHAGELSAKTVNNARMCLSMALAEAARRGLIVRNPCERVSRLPVERTELDYLRLAEIERYLDACPDYHRPLAEFLIGTGARISEALAVRWSDIDFARGIVGIARQRARSADATVATKGKRFRSVQMGPQLATTLRELRKRRQSTGVDDCGWVFVCPPPARGRYAGRTEAVPPSRKTAHDWHEATLQDAGLRDMPLHALRHTAATAWLASGQPLIFVQRQLGHRSITTTEEHYGHLEVSFVRDAAARTEATIASAARRRV